MSKNTSQSELTLDNFKHSEQEDAYVEACVALLKKNIVDKTKVREEDIHIAKSFAKVVNWTTRVSFHLEFLQSIEKHTGAVKPTVNLLRVNNEAELTNKTDGFLQMERERAETIFDLAERLNTYRVGESLNSKLLRTHPMEAVWEYTCTSCGGEGKVVCPRCNEKGYIRCEECDGDGTVMCPTCNGKRNITCSNCHGSTTQTCSSYRCAFGYVSCYRCNGSGIITNYPERQYCRECNGHGRYRCKQCEGTGLECCSMCTSGKVPCQSCNAKGTKTCSVCKGRGTVCCPTCNGNGKVKCKDCNGTGTIHFIGSARAQYEGILYVPRLKELFFDPHEYYAETYHRHRPPTILEQEKRIDIFFDNSVPFCVLVISPCGRESEEEFLEVGLHGKEPQVHQESRIMQKVYDAFLRERVQAFLEQTTSTPLSTRHLSQKISSNLNSLVKIPIVLASFSNDGKSEQEKKALVGIKQCLRVVSLHYLLRGLASHFFLLALIAFILSFNLIDFSAITAFEAKQNIQLHDGVHFLLYSLVQGLVIALISRFYYRRYVSSISEILLLWGKKHHLLYGENEALVLLVCGAIVSLSMPLGVHAVSWMNF